MPLMRLALLVLASSLAVAGGQSPDPSAQAPKAPEGWQYITAKDGTYQFLFPTQTKGSGSREQTSKRGGITGRAQINYCQAADGTALAIAATSMSGPALKGLKIGDVYNLMIDSDKEDSTDMSEPKDVVVGKLKGKEYTFTKGANKVRKVLLVVRGRVFEMSAVAAEKEKTMGASADTFLKSLVMIAKPAPSKGESKEGDKATTADKTTTGDKATAGDTLPATPPPTARLKLTQTAAYRPTFKYTDGKEESAGTAFVIKSPAGKKLALTAAHVLEPKEWAALSSTTLSTMAGKKVVEVAGKPAYVGRAFDQLPELRKGAVPILNTSEDFAIWVLPDTADVTVLELADHEPKVNEWVWVVGQQPGKQLLFYRSKVTQVLNGTMLFDQFDRFDPTGFSGGPVVTAEGKVIGTMLAGAQRGNMRQGATVGNIRKRIKDQ
jgi:hypothetical protein